MAGAQLALRGREGRGMAVRATPTRAVTYAEEAAVWAAKGDGQLTNFDAFELAWARLHRGLAPDALRADPAAISAEVSRLERERGLERRWLPALERLAIMDSPSLRAVRAPRRCDSLDSQHGTSVLRVLFRGVTGRMPQVRSWRLA